MTAEPPQGDFRYDGPARVPGGLQQPPAARTGHALRELGLDARAFNALSADGITTIEQVEAMSDQQLLRIVNFGRSSCWHTRNSIQRWRATFPQPDPRPVEIAALLRRLAELIEDIAARPLLKTRCSFSSNSEQPNAP